MIRPLKIRWVVPGITLLAACLAFSMLGAIGCVGVDIQKTLTGVPAETVMTWGEDMYRKGILPSGKPMRAALQVPGTTFACAGCHLRSGIGVMDEGPQTLSVNGEKLYRPLYRYFPNLTQAEWAESIPARFKTPPLRPAYTDATLSTAIRKGLDPNGRAFNTVMPRFQLDDRDMAILIAYLKALSSTPSPGVTDTTMSFATVVTDEVPEEDREEMMGQLEQRFQMHDNLAPNPSLQMGRMLIMQKMGLSYRKWELSLWTLKGSPDTWPSQLENFYRQKPVFALIGGMSTVSWEPIHRFCETNQIPCLFPFADLPAISDTDYYTLYFSKGYVQEGEAAARYLDKIWEASKPKHIVQFVDMGPEAKALAKGFEDTWKELGHEPIRTIRAGKDLSLEVRGLADQDSALLLWTGPESYEALKALAGAPNRPASVFMSSTRLLGKLWDLPTEARAFTYVTYPYRQPGERFVPGKMGGKPVKVSKEFRKNDRRISSRAYTTIGLLTDRLVLLQRDFYRDHLLALFDSFSENDLTDYEQLNFGPGKRYVSEGCYIMQVAPGTEPNLIRKSDWIVR